MVLKLPKFLDEHYPTLLFTSIICLLGLWAFIDYADAEYCSDTCQAKKQKEIEERKQEIEDRNKTEEEKEAGTCYGIYCDKVEKKVDQSQRYIDNLSRKNFISIRVQGSCEITGTCPSVKELADVYDNSNKYLSGDFYFNNDTNKWERTKPIVPNVFEYYKTFNMPWVLWLEPDHYTWRNSKQIIIVPELNYIDRKDIIEERTRIQYIGLDFEPCASATIGWKNNGDEILLDVLNHFMSNCKEDVQYDPRQEIFLNSTIFEGCDKTCLFLKEQSKRELKAFYQTEKEYYEQYSDEAEDKDDKPKCYGAFCDRDEDEDLEYPEDRPETIKEKVEVDKIKKQKYEERLKELEEIQECEKYKREEDNQRAAQKIDCEDEDDRSAYLKDQRIERGIKTATNSTKKEEVKCYGIHCD